MFTQEEATAERIASYRGALEDERTQLELALQQAQAAENDHRVERAKKRLAANAAELARVKKLKPVSHDED